MFDSEYGYTGKYCRVEKISRTYEAFDIETGERATDEISAPTRSKAAKEGFLLGEYLTKTGYYQWRMDKSRPVDSDQATSPVVSTPTTTTTVPPVEVDFLSMVALMNGVNTEDNDSVIKFVHRDSLKLKPETLVMPELKWKYLIHAALRGENILMTGPSGFGKTFAAQCLADTFPNRKFFYINLGSTQDVRASLIGNTHYDPEKGTFFSKSYFIQAITTPGAIILLDEISRAHPDAWNILMTPLDPKQRYVRLDESEDAETVSVAPGVTFVATANIGAEYTATRVMDWALTNRFAIVEMEILDEAEETYLLHTMFPQLPDKLIEATAKIACWTREQVKSESPEITALIPTRTTVRMCSLMADGFSLEEVVEVCVYPSYDTDGGLDSERTKVKQVVQAHLPPPEDLDDDLLKNVGGSIHELSDWVEQPVDSDGIIWEKNTSTGEMRKKFPF